MNPATLSPATKAILALPVALLVAALILIGSLLAFGGLMEGETLSALPAPAQESLFVFLCFGLLAAAAVGGAALLGVRVPAHGKPLADGPAGLALGAVGLAAAVALAGLAGTLVAGAGTDGGGLVLLLGLGIALIPAGAEELYFRGWLQPVLQDGWGRGPGLLATAAAFAAAHTIGGDVDPLSLLNLFLGGIWFGLLAERSGGLWLPIGAHWGWNAAEELLFGVTPNPGAGSFGALFDWDLAGAGMWGGSEAGLNASLATAFALCAMIAAAAGWSRPLSSPATRG